MGIIVWIIPGPIAGITVKLIIPGRDGDGFFLTCILGIVGTVVGGWLVTIFDIGGSISGFNPHSFLVTVVGAIFVLGIFRLLRREQDFHEVDSGTNAAIRLHIGAYARHLLYGWNKSVQHLDARQDWFSVATTESFFNYCSVVFGAIREINILDISQSGVKNGANSEAVLTVLTERSELINPSGRLSRSTRSAMLQLHEEGWSEFFFRLLNSLERLDYMITNSTPEGKRTLMSEHRNDIRVAIDALYRQRRCKSPGDGSETLTHRSDATFGNHIWQTFMQYFPPRLEGPSVQETPQLRRYLPITPSGEAE